MSNIYVNVTGNGTGWVDNPTPNNGDIITIYAYANTGATLIDVTMQSQYGYYIAVSVVPVQQIAYDSSWGDCTIDITCSADIITLNSNGNGWASVDNLNPDNGDSVRLSCTPGGSHYQVVDIIVTDANGNMWQLPPVDDQYFTYDSSWGDITIDVYFDLKWLYNNIWILFQRQWWRKNNY